MVRIKVVHASHLLFGAAIVLLVVTLAIVGVLYLRGDTQAASTRLGTTQMVKQEEAAAVFAAASSAPRTALFDPAMEDEHTDPAVSGFDVQILPRSSIPKTAQATPLPPTATEMPVVSKRVLIYHTHTNEAYDQTENDPYVQSDRWRTNDQTHSIVRVGDELAELLRGFGLTVVHDATDHEPPKLGTAYVRSLDTLAKYKNQSFDLYIDLHRDAYDEAIISARAVSVGGSELAQLMVLIGNGEGFEDKPDTEANLVFGRALTSRVNE